MFTDRVHLHLAAGKGGNGVVAWRREKYIPKGGPAGGDGGNGGSIILEATDGLFSLEDLRNKRKIKAKNGSPGGANNRCGKSGQDLTIKVPLGTLVKNSSTQEILFDFTEPGQRWNICLGGVGGKGNSRFKSSTNQAPNFCTEGTDGESTDVELELKLIADVGLVGMPNAGKSTLISKLANAAVKIAPYPFTTLRPNLGLIVFEDFSRLLIADIPGIIQDAHVNRGLGLSFLRHIERSSTLIYLIELCPYDETRDPYKEFEMLREELRAHNPTLLEKPSLVVLNKTDLEGAEEQAETFRKQYPFPENGLFTISAQEGNGCSSLLEGIRRLAQKDGKKF